MTIEAVISPILKVSGDIEKIGHCKLGNLSKAHQYSLLRYNEKIGICVHVHEVVDIYSFFTDKLKVWQFYHRNIHILEHGVVMTRNLPFGRQAVLCMMELNSPSPNIVWNPWFRWWSSLKGTRVGPLGVHLESVAALKLIECGKTLIHAGIVCGNEGGVVVAGLPNQGKTWTVLSLVSNGYQFLSEDVGIISREGMAYALPFTTSIKDWPSNRWKKNLPSTKKAVLIDVVENLNIAESCKVRRLIFLERSASNRYSRVSSEEAARLILSLNRLEFEFPRHTLLFAYCMANGMLIDDYLQHERAIVQDFVSHVEAFKVEFENYDTRDLLIKELVGNG